MKKVLSTILPCMVCLPQGLSAEVHLRQLVAEERSERIKEMSSSRRAKTTFPDSGGRLVENGGGNGTISDSDLRCLTYKSWNNMVDDATCWMLM